MAQIGYQSGYPVSSYRVIFGIMAACFFGFLLYSASVKSGWFTTVNQFALFYGILLGLALGVVEAKIVSDALIDRAEVTIWRMLILNIAFAAVTLAIAYLSSSSLIQFLAYAVLAGIPADLLSSGILFMKFEKPRKVSVFIIFYGLKYWKQPNPSINDRFYYFTASVSTKNPTTLWQYAGVANKLLKVLEQKTNADPVTKVQLEALLKTMRKYMKTIWYILMVLAILMITFLIFVLSAAYVGAAVTRLVNFFVGFYLSIYLAIFFTSIPITMHVYRKRMAKKLADIEIEKLSTF